MNSKSGTAGVGSRKGPRAGAAGRKGPPRGKPWSRGQSGNPRGRPRVKPKTLAEREALKRATDDTYAKVIEGVKLAQSFAPTAIGVLAADLAHRKPDVRHRAATLLLERALWPRTQADMPQLLPEFAQGSISDRASAIMAAVADGRITPAMGMTLASLLNLSSDAALSAEVASKLAQLRQALAARGLAHLAPEVPVLPAVEPSK